MDPSGDPAAAVTLWVVLALVLAVGPLFLLAAGLTKRWRLGKLSWPIAAVLRREGGCFRCRTSWIFVRRHVTPYEPGRGVTVLCEGCWSSLTPEGRWTYYARFLVAWYDRLATDDENEALRIRRSATSIQAALRAGA